ncbi:hypothetical protein Tco_0876988 [Tanacetum coccineum]|uniref:Uncharacterized protein n=1 Tax=Tanacetum coccineum TaxID=301880 RepID=A0ABQ5BWV2_9ASTR
MSKQTSSGTSKAKAFTKDRPEGQPPNAPRYQPIARPPNHFVSRPTCHLVSIPKGVSAGRGGNSSASGNGDWFVDDRRDISEYIDEGNRHVVRPRGIHGGRVGRSNGSELACKQAPPSILSSISDHTSYIGMNQQPFFACDTQSHRHPTDADDHRLNATTQAPLVRRSDLWRYVKKRVVIKDTSTSALNTSVVTHPTADTPKEVTRSPTEVSSIRKHSRSTTPFLNADIESQQIPAKSAQTVCHNRNVRMRLKSTQSNKPVKVGGLPTTAEQYLRASDIITNHHTSVRHMKPVYLFPRFLIVSET